MTTLQLNRHPRQVGAHSFARDAAAISFSIVQLVATLKVEAASLASADRLKAQSLIDRVKAEALELMLLANRIEQGILPR